MKITPENFEKYTILTVEGRVDATTAETFYTQTAEFLEKDNKPLLLDFSNLEYISSAGLTITFRICQQMHPMVQTALMQIQRRKKIQQLPLIQTVKMLMQQTQPQMILKRKPQINLKKQMIQM